MMDFRNEISYTTLDAPTIVGDNGLRIAISLEARRALALVPSCVLAIDITCLRSPDRAGRLVLSFEGPRAKTKLN
jgi:hypothetical protein